MRDLAEFPSDMPGFLKLCQALKAKNTPAGFALGNATGDRAGHRGWCGRSARPLVDAHNNVAISSPQMLQALEYAKELYPNFHPGQCCRGSTRTTTRRSSTASWR